ncbi:MAG: transposase [Clostridiaceae bacterium]
MPRQSRVKDNYGVYHIKQSGSSTQKLFNGEEDRENFLDILQQVKAKNNFKILAYCVSDEAEYHLILDANGCDVSKIMKEINIKYSIYKNCPGCLFKDRFRSELLNSSFASETVEISSSTAGNQKDPFSSCSQFLKKLEAMSILDQTPFLSGPGDVQDVFQRGTQERINTMEQATAHLLAEAGRRGQSLDEIMKDKPLRNELMIKLKCCSTLSMKQIGIIFGGLSESTVSKLLNSKSSP